jgi:acyl-coenzyme A synthetase/AMP-(fatty) acid ligase
MNNKINLAYLPPVLLSQLPQKDYPNLNSLIYAGESCDKKTASLWSHKVKLFNYYGPTEATIYATYKQILSDEVELIGAPIQNTRVYVLDPHMVPVPIGVIGELYIGGAGLARGYLNNKALTEERFIPNLFASRDDETKGYTRLYKTGDLVRWLADGNLEYIGRNDEQVKIRGYRIELAEIEHALTNIPGIKQSCVLAKERKTGSGMSRYLAGYYLLDNDNQDLTQTIILDKLSRILPDYMVPTALLEVKFFPLTINGKLDKKALPDPDFNSSEHYLAPTNEIEVTLCGIWQDVLGLEKVGITDDFFRIGGNSILAIQVSHRMSKVLDRDIKVADIFKSKNIHIILKDLLTPQFPNEGVEWEFK